MNILSTCCCSPLAGELTGTGTAKRRPREAGCSACQGEVTMPQKSQANTSFLTPEIINSAGEAMFNQISFRKRLGPASLLVFAFSNNPDTIESVLGKVERFREYGNRQRTNHTRSQPA